MLKKSASTPIGVDNMIMLDNLTEETILVNLEIRFKQMQIYVCFLIIANFTFINQLSLDLRGKYSSFRY